MANVMEFLPCSERSRLNFRLQPSLTLAIEKIWGMNQHVRTLSVLFHLPTSQINKQKIEIQRRHITLPGAGYIHWMNIRKASILLGPPVPS